VHIIKGYGDTAVAEHTIALMWAAARGWRRWMVDARGALAPHRGMELTGKTLGLLGFGGIAAEWRGSPPVRDAGAGVEPDAETAPGVTFSIWIRCWRSRARCCRCICF